MPIGDTAKAVGLAALILALNMLVTTAVIFCAFALKHSVAAEGAEAARIAGWSAPIAGAALFLAAASLLGRRQPGRNPYAFALRTWIAYVILDVGSGVAMGDEGVTFTWQMALSMTIALAAALAGAALARPPRVVATA